jgi:chromosome segregation ATPase
MSSRSLTPPPASTDADLETTAELPVLDPPAAAAAAAAEEAHGATDTWAALPQLRPEDERHLETKLEALSAELRSAQQLLHNKGDRLRELEREREEARASLAAAEQRAAEGAAATARLEESAARQATQLAELTQARVAAEHQAAGLVAELAHLRSGGDSATETLSQLRAAAEQRAAQLDAELVRLRAAATQHTAQFSELTQGRAAAERRLSERDAQLSAVSGELAVVSARAAELQQRVDAQEKAAAAEQLRIQKSEEARAQRERAHAAHTAGVMHDLHAERARAAAYFESLTTLGTRRSVFEELVTDLHAEAQVRESDVAKLAHELAVREARVREQDAELAQRATRITLLEQQVVTINSALAERDTQQREGRRESQTLQANLQRLQAQLESSGERVRALSAVAEQHNTTESQRKTELSRLLTERVELTAALEAARDSAGAASARGAELEGALSQLRSRAAELDGALAGEKKRAAELEEELGTQRRSRAAELDGALAGEKKRAAELEEELSAQRREMEDWGEALKSMHRERDSYQSGIAAAEARAREAEHRADEEGEALAAVQAQAGASATRVRELEADLAAAEESLHRLEAEARKSGARVEELEKSNQLWRATIEEARHSVTDTNLNALLRDAVRGGEAPEAPGMALPDGAVRLMIYSVEGREVVHVLGRKTSVGRTPDNDLQIDAKFISRHHAVILAGPAQTIIEDLNSTNGVQVNGRRITRQALEDGDVVAIGRQQYRFVVRKNSDKR